MVTVIVSAPELLAAIERLTAALQAHTAALNANTIAPQASHPAADFYKRGETKAP
jgi:hypothetical protein